MKTPKVRQAPSRLRHAHLCLAVADQEDARQPRSLHCSRAEVLGAGGSLYATRRRQWLPESDQRGKDRNAESESGVPRTVRLLIAVIMSSMTSHLISAICDWQLGCTHH